jgi:hypothetical protein
MGFGAIETDNRIAASLDQRSRVPSPSPALQSSSHYGHKMVVYGEPKTRFAECFKTAAAVLIRESGW